MDSNRLVLGDVMFSDGNKERITASLTRNTTLRQFKLPNSTWTDATTNSLCNLLEQNKTLDIFWLDKAQLSPPELIHLCEVLTNNRTLLSVILSNTTWTPDSIAALCHLLQNSKLQILQLQDAKFTPTHIIRLCEALQENQTLQHLTLTKTSWNTSSVEALCACIRANTTLESLGLGEAKFTPTHITRLCEALQENQTLQVLDLTKASWSDPSLEALCACIRANTTLQVLGLREAAFSPDQMLQLLEALSTNRRLRYLNLSNSTWREESLDSLCACLRHNTTLQVLDFNDSVFTDAAGDAICQFLRSNSRLQDLCFAYTTFTDRGLVSLLDALRDNNTLHYINFYASTLTDAVVNDFCSFLKENNTLNTLNVSWSKLTDRGVLSLLHGLVRNRSLIHLSIENAVSDAVMTELGKFLEKNSTIKKLEGTDVTDLKLRWGLQELMKLDNVQESKLLGKTMNLEVKHYGQSQITRITAKPSWELSLQGSQTQPSDKAATLERDPRQGPETHKPHSGHSSVRSLIDKFNLSHLQQERSSRTPQSSALHASPPQSERPWEIQALEPAYRQAYDEACKRGTESVCQARVMVVGSYAVGKSNLVGCLLEKKFQEEHKTTIGINADPNEAKIEITKASNWAKHQDESFQTKIARHVVHASSTKIPSDNAAMHDPEEETDMTINISQPSSPTSPYDELARSSSPAKKTEATSASLVAPASAGSAKPQSRHPASTKQTKVKPSEAANAGTSQKASPRKADVKHQIEQPQVPPVPPEIMEEIAKEEERKRKEQKRAHRKGLSQEMYFWDYAGQGVFYNTHQIFLTARSLYIVVASLRQKLTDAVPTYRMNIEGQLILDKSCPQTVQDYLEYWLSSIFTNVELARRTAGVESTAWEPQVVIALTHKDVSSADEVKEYQEELNRFLKDKGYRFLIEDIVTISNKERAASDVKKLKDTLQKLGKMRNYKVPLSWFKLKEGIMQQEKKSLTLADVKNIATDQDLIITETDIKAALTFLHEVGEVVYFGEGQLADFIVRDVQWLIDEFKKVITIAQAHKDTQKYIENATYWADLDNNGVLHQKLLQSVWPDEDTRKKLLTTMMNFSLLMPAPSHYLKDATREDPPYLVPCLLPPTEKLQEDPQPEAARRPSARIIRLYPNIGFLPAGLISRLISSLSVGYNWEVCGPVYRDSATFRPSQSPESAVSIRKLSADSSRKIEVIEVTFNQGEKSTDNSLNDIFTTISRALQYLPGRNGFGVWVCCDLCRQWNFICTLEESSDRRVYERRLCETHGPMLKESDHAPWFHQNIKQMTPRSTPDKVLFEQKAATERLTFAKFVDVGGTTGLDVWESIFRQDVTTIYELVDLLSFVSGGHQQQLVKTAPSAEVTMAAKHLINDIKTSPLWKVKGFLSAFPQDIQKLIMQIVGFDAGSSGNLVNSIQPQHVGSYKKRLLEIEAAAGESQPMREGQPSDERQLHEDRDNIAQIEERHEHRQADLRPTTAQPTNCFSRTFTAEGGVLRSKTSDVVLSVPNGAIPLGETVNVCVKVHTNLEEYSEWVKEDKEHILGPVVECLVDRNIKFQQAVTVTVPLYLTPAEFSDVKVLYSVGDRFQDISSDDKMSFKVINDTLVITTPHFTKFIVKAWKTVKIKKVLLTVAASHFNVGSGSNAEVRLMAHVNCSTLKDFEHHRKGSYPKGMEEIDWQDVRLPERSRKMVFPDIKVQLQIKGGLPWQIVKFDKDGNTSLNKQVEYTVDGRDVLLHSDNWGSKLIQNFILESTTRAEQVSFYTNITFDYKGAGCMSNDFSIVFPRPTSPSLTNQLGAESQRSVSTSASSIQSALECQTGQGEQKAFEVSAAEKEKLVAAAGCIKDELQYEQPRLIGAQGIGDLTGSRTFIAHIRALKILTEIGTQEIETERTSGKKAAELIRHLLPRSPGRLILFAWVLVQEGQAHQLPQSLTRDVKKVLRGYSQEGILRLVEDFNGEGCAASASVSQLSVKQKKGTTPGTPTVFGGGATGGYWELWDKRHPGSLELVMDVYPRLIIEKLPKLKKVLKLGNVWDELRKLNVASRQDIDSFKVEATDAVMVQRFMDYIEVGPMWRFHRFLKALAITDNEHIIAMLGFKLEDYSKNV